MTKKLSEMSNQELQDEFVAYDETINKVGCYGTKDLMWLNAIEKEIARRGGEIQTESSVSFPEDDGEECPCGDIIHRGEDDLDQCANCGLMYHEGHPHKCEETETIESKGWCCELCGGLIKGECMSNGGYIIHSWGNCSADEEDEK